MSADVKRWVIAVIAALAIIGLLAWARNGPGVGGRQPDPPGATVVGERIPGHVHVA